MFQVTENRFRIKARLRQNYNKIIILSRIRLERMIFYRRTFTMVLGEVTKLSRATAFW